MQIEITNELIGRALLASAAIEGVAPEALLAPSLADITNGHHLRGDSREPLTEGYVAWLEAQAAEAVAARSAQLHQDIGA